MDTKRITIGMPVYGGIQPQTFQSLLELVADSKHEIDIVMAEDGYTIAENRNFLAVKALNNKSDYLLMVDADMTFPPDMLDTLLADGKDIVGVAYHPRSETGQITKYLDEVHFVKIEESDDPKYKKTFKCYATGTGVILIKCDVFKKMARPWFKFEFYDTGQCKQGEDWIFCIEAGKLGIETWTNPTIEIGHWGEKIF
jgi:hypothetical protein